MGLRQEVVKVGDRELVMKELSFAAQLRLQKKEALGEKIAAEDIYREMMSEEDFKFLEQIGRKEYSRVREAFNRLQQDDEPEGFLQQPTGTNGK